MYSHYLKDLFSNILFILYDNDSIQTIYAYNFQIVWLKFQLTN